MSPISSRNSVPPSACSKRPRRSASAPVNEPFSWPNSSDSSSSAVNRRGVQRDEGLVGARAVPVQRTGDEFLAGARFTGDQHRHAGARQPADRAKHLLHRGRLAQHLRNPRGRRRRLFGASSHLVRGAAHQVHRLVDVERLGQVFERAALVGRDGAVQVGVRRHHDDGQLGLLARHLGAQQLQARLARHADVGHQHIGLPRRSADSASAASNAVGVMPALLQRAFQDPADRGIVIDEPDAKRTRSFLASLDGQQEREEGAAGRLVNSIRPPCRVTGPAPRRARGRCRSERPVTSG
jgi:hypothetical protein